MIDKTSRLTFVTKSDRRGYGVYVCTCGTRKEITRWSVNSGKVLSCGCLHSELSSARTKKLHQANTTHGKSRSREHSIWLGMKQRCCNPNNPAFSYYGGRGITVCARWLDSFENFHADMGDPPPNSTIDRVDQNGPYEPSNCRWASRKEQQNNLRSNRRVTVGNITLTISQWAELTGLHRNTIDQRLKAGWSPEKAVTDDNARKQYRQTHCKRGHELTVDNVYMQGRSRSCKVCAKERARKQTDDKRRVREDGNSRSDR
jgi:hypothetical protein